MANTNKIELPKLAVHRMRRRTSAIDLFQQEMPTDKTCRYCKIFKGANMSKTITHEGGCYRNPQFILKMSMEGVFRMGPIL